jgi:hypothetical protein
MTNLNCLKVASDVSSSCQVKLPVGWQWQFFYGSDWSEFSFTPNFLALKQAFEKYPNIEFHYSN